jgi:hypothetical protein
LKLKNDFKNHNEYKNQEGFLRGNGPWFEFRVGANRAETDIFRVIVKDNYDFAGVLVHPDGLGNGFYEPVVEHV